MARVKSRIQRLQRQQRYRLYEEAIRQFENRSPDEYEFFASHGYFEVSNNNQRAVTPEEVRAFEKDLKALARGRTDADLVYYAEHGSWPERDYSQS